MRTSTIYFIGSFLMFLMFVSKVAWKSGNSSEILCFFDGVAFGWGVVSGTLSRIRGD